MRADIQIIKKRLQKIKKEPIIDFLICVSYKNLTARHNTLTAVFFL